MVRKVLLFATLAVVAGSTFSFPGHSSLDFFDSAPSTDLNTRHGHLGNGIGQSGVNDLRFSNYGSAGARSDSSNYGARDENSGLYGSETSTSTSTYAYSDSDGADRGSVSDSYHHSDTDGDDVDEYYEDSYDNSRRNRNSGFRKNSFDRPSSHGASNLNRGSNSLGNSRLNELSNSLGNSRSNGFSDSFDSNLDADQLRRSSSLGNTGSFAGQHLF